MNAKLKRIFKNITHTITHRLRARWSGLFSHNHEENNIVVMSGWVIGPYMKVVGEYMKSLEKYPNPKPVNMTEFGK